MRWNRKVRGIAGLVVLAVPMTAFAAAPDAATEFVFDLWHSRGHEQHLRDCRAAGARMEIELRATSDRISIKEQLIGDLIAGRRQFLEVVHQFELLNADRPSANAPLPQGYTLLGDEERAAYSVLMYVSRRGEPVGHAVPRLEAEYEARYGRPVPGKKMTRD